MPRSRAAPRLCVLLAVLAITAWLVHAADATTTTTTAAPVPTDCAGLTTFTHLDGWPNSDAVDQDTIYLLNLYYSAAADTDGIVEALQAGLSAALEAAAYATESGRKIVMVSVKRASTTEDLPGLYVQEAVCCFGDRLFGVVGPFSDNRMTELLQTHLLFNNNLVALGPYTGSSTVRYFSENMYFMRADPVAELYAMLSYIINRQQDRRIGYAYLTDRSFGDDELEMGRGYIERVGSAVSAVYKGDGNSDMVDMEAFQQLVDAGTQSIIVYSYPGTHTAQLLRLLLSNEKLVSTKIFVPSFLNYLLVEAANEIEAETGSDGQPLHSAHRERVFSTSTNFPAYATSMHHIQQFRADMTAYIEAHPSEPYSSPSIIDEEPAFSEVMINGWIVGEMLLNIFERESWVTGRGRLQTGLFQQNRYVVSEDFVLGDYGGACYSTLEKLQGATCECNQGGTTALTMQHYANKSQRIISNSVFSYSPSTCYASDVWLPLPVNMITVNYEGDPLFHRIETQLEVPVQLAADSLNSYLVGTSAVAYNTRVLESHTSTAQADLDTYMATHRVDIIIGSVLLGTDTADTLILSPTYRKPHATFPDANKVVIRPTLEQQFYVACDFLSRPSSDHVFTKGSTVHVVLSDMGDENTDSIVKTVKRTAETFRHRKPRIRSVTDNDALEDILEPNAVSFLLGMLEEDVTGLVAYLQKNPKAMVVLMFHDVMLFYDELVEAFTATSEDVQERLVFPTNYPMWNDDSAEGYAQYPILKSFHAAMGDSKYYTPRAFEAYVTVRLVDVLASSLQTINAKELREQLYHTSNFLIDDFRLGPFNDCDGGDKDCVLRNYGANDISIVSMSRIITPSQHKIFGPVTPDMVYTKPLLTTGTIVAIAVCGGLALIAMIVVPIVVCMCCCRTSRDNKNAPKDSHHPVTVIFTDIESSTALWGTVPQIMPDAVAAHHKLIREIIAAHKSYEVKTVGDSFMIACKRPFAAVQIAQDIQKRFLAHDWDAEIDECYRQFEQRRAADPDNESYAPHSANLVRDVYEALWRGLRVRIGVHTGLSDIRQDEITGGFDYYGETSNMAARTEAIGNGGQVLLTDATWWALSQAEREALQVTSLGHQPLRGVSYPVEMYQLCVAAGRQYPPLRLDVDAYLPNDDATDGGSMATDDMASSSAATLTGPSAAIATVLTNCFSPYPAARRIKELQPLLQKWGIPVPPRHRRVAEDDYCQGLINRLALKMSAVVQLRSKLDGGRATGTMGFSGTTGARSHNSRVASDAFMGPACASTGLSAAALAPLTKPVQLPEETPSRRSSRLPLHPFTPLASPNLTPARGPRQSTSLAWEMMDVSNGSHVGMVDSADGSGTHSPHVDNPLSLRPAQRHRGMGAAAVSLGSEMYQSVHVPMPLSLQ